MAVIEKYQTIDCLWGIWKIDESSDELLNMLSHREWYDIEINRFKSAHRLEEWLATRVLLKNLLNEEKQILYDANRKPYLQDKSYHVGISHSKGYVAVIVSKYHHVAIDIEHYGTRINKLQSKFMRSDELVSSFKDEQTWSLLLNWSAKETLYKLVSEHEMSFKKLKVLPFKIDSKGMFQICSFWNSGETCYDISYQIFNTYVLTWAIL